MPHPASNALPILAVAAALGIKVNGRKARCFNGAAHKGGSDRNPSLTFLPDVNRFKCYTCEARGDAIDLVRGVLGVSFADAVQRLYEMAGQAPGKVSRASRASMPVSATSRSPTPRSKEIYARLFEITYSLGPRSPGGKYLAGRGINLDVSERCRVQALLPNKTWKELTEEFDERELRAAGLVSHRGRFLFGNHHLLFFFFDDGRPEFVMARDITGTSSCKELSLAGLRSPVPYLSDSLRGRPDRVLVCEGCVDTLSATQLGYAAVGVPGVTGFQDEWFSLFRGVGRVTILFDNDDAGRRQGAELRATFRMQGIKADAQFPTRGKDLNDLLKPLHEGVLP